MQRTSRKSLALAAASRKSPVLPGMNAKSYVYIFHKVRKLTDSTRPFTALRVDCKKPTTQHETFLRVFVNVKEYQSKLSSVLSTGGNHAKSDEHWRDSTFFDRRLICDETRGFCKTHSFSVFKGSIYDRYIGCNFTRLLTTNFTRLFPSLFFTLHVNYVVSGGLIFQLSGQHETFYAFSVRFARGASTSKKLESKSQRRTRLFVSLPWGPARHGGQRGSKRAMDSSVLVQRHKKHHTSSKCNQETVFIYS